MSEKHATLEVIAPSIDEAIEKGLSDLGLVRAAVDVKVLDEGSTGLFGLGSRQARIMLIVKDDGTCTRGGFSERSRYQLLDRIYRIGRVIRRSSIHFAARP